MGLLGPEKNSGALLSDGSWYSAEEDFKDEEKVKVKIDQNPVVASSKTTSSSVSNKLVHTRSDTVENFLDGGGKLSLASKLKSRSAEDLLDRLAKEEEGGTQRAHPPLARTRCTALSRNSSGSSVEEYATANSRPLSGASDSDEPGGDKGGKSSLESDARQLKVAAGPASAVSSASPKSVAVVPVAVGREGRGSGSSGGGSAGERISRWRSFEDLLGALPLQKRRPRWLRRNRTHHVAASFTPSPLLKRRSSEPAFSDSPPVGKVRLELTFNPETSMIGIRLHEHTLSEAKTDLTVQTYLYPRVSVESKEAQSSVISFKKTHYSHTLVATFKSDSALTDMALQLSLETSGRFFSRLSGHVILELGPLLLPSPSLSCDRWFPLFQTPLYPPNNAHHEQ
jgi:hypothetical protein